MKRTRTLTGFFLSAMLLVLTSQTAHAQTTNALDRIDFGNPTSEAAHNFDPAGGAMPLTGTGAFGQTYRRAWTGTGSQPTLQFTAKCDPSKQNYVTIKSWGSDRAGGFLYLNSTISDPDFDSNYGSPLEYPGRWVYNTAPIPIAMTQGKTTVQLTFTDGDSAPGRQTYTAYVHTDPRFVPDASEAQGIKPVQTGYITPAALTGSQVISLLQSNRQAIYGPGNYYDTLVGQQIPAGTAGAPPEVIGLHLNNTLANESSFATPEQWRDDAYNSTGGPGYSKVPDQMISALVSTYFLPPFKDASGNTVAGLDHYQDPTIISRIVSAFDGCTYLQVGDGGFGQNYGEWQGLTSTPRASTSNWPGTTARAPGWSISIEGVDSEVLGYTLIKLLNDPTAAPLLKNYLSQSYNADLTGTPLLRATAYERMLSNHINYLYQINGGTESQNMFQMVGLYACEIALDKLQALYPNTSYKGVGPAEGASRMEKVLGLVPDTGMGGTDPSYYGGSAFPNYGLTAGGFGEAHGALSCGYDGRYGTIMPWLAARFTQLAAWDPAVTPAILSAAQKAARTTVDGFDQFISPLDNTGYSNDIYYNKFTLAQEDFITYRDTYMPNADGNSFMVLGEYLDSDPAGPLQDGYALRSAYLEALYGNVPSLGAGGSSAQNYLKDTAAYESTLRSLIGVDPSTLKSLPGEPGQSNHAMVDAQSGAAALYYNGERLYMNANWDNFENNNTGSHFQVSNVARIHDSTPTMDRAAEIILPHDASTVQNDGNLSGSLDQGWVVRYGSYLIAGNNSAANITITLPAGSGSALELVSGKSYALGSSVTLSPGMGAAFVLPGAGGSGNGTAPLLADGVYTLTNQSSSLFMDDRTNGINAGTLVDQAAATNGLGQKWLLSNLGGGIIRLTNAESDLYLDTASSASGAGIVQNPLNFSSSQTWHLAVSSSGYTLTNAASGFVLEVPGGSSTPGIGLDQAAASGGTNQQWALTPASLIPNGTYTLTNPASGLAFDASGGMTPQTPTGATSQQWAVTNYGGSLISFADLADNQSVQVLYGYTIAGSRLAGSGSKTGANVVWQVSPVGGGQIAITGLASSLLAEIPSGGTAGSQLDLGLPLATANQLWNFATTAAFPQTLTLQQNQATAITLTGKDLNTPAQTLTFAVTKQPQHGTLTGTAPNLTYTPTSGFSGTDSFVFTAGDAGTTAPATVTITVLPAGAVLAGDSSFETPAVGAASYQQTPTGSPWTFTGNSGIQSNGSAWGAPNAPDGTQTAFLQGNGSNGTISQSLSFSAAGTYVVSFQAAQRSGQVQPVQVSVDGVAVGSPISPTGTAFAPYSSAPFTISAAGSHTIKLAATDSTGDKTTFIDQVVIRSAATVATAASATPNPVTGKTTSVSVLGADPGGEANLTYTWTATGPAAVTFSPNGTNAAKNAAATFSQAGSYTLTATITNTAGANTASSVTVPVSQTLTAVAVTPATVFLDPSGIQQFTATATDQFGSAITPAPSVTWAATGDGTISTAGLFTAGSNAGTASVTATTGSLTSAAAGVTVLLTGSFETPSVGTGSYQYDPTGSPWTFSGNSGIQSNGSAWGAPNAPDGTQTAFLQGNGSNGTISQSLSFSAAGTYHISFQAAQRSGQIQPIQVSVDGVAVGSPISPTGTAFASYSSASFTISTAGSHTIKLAATDSTGDKTTFIDKVTVISSPLSVANAASATPNPVTGKTTSVSVLGADPGGEANLTYTWTATGPAAVTFSPNGTNAAKNAAATFSQAGSYTLTATITNAAGANTASSVTVPVSQTLTAVAVTPAAATVAAGGIQQFTATATDQFGSAITPAPAVTWAATGGGTITSGGLFTAGNTAGGPYTITATSGSLSGTATVTVTATDVLALNAGSGAAGSFAADADFSGGTTYATTAAISTQGVTNPAPQTVYQTERYGNFTYTLPNLTPGASYTLRLHFAELYWNAAGQRVFNVAVNGTPVLSNFDIFAAAGGANKAIVKTFTVQADSSGKVTVVFTTVTDSAKLSGLELLVAPPAPTDVLALNAGSGAAGSFAADADFSGGTTYATTAAISTQGVTNPAPQTVYQTERYGNFTYTLPNLTPGASYTLRLHFAELYWNAAGQRVFNVAVNGTPVLSNFDIFAAAGGANKAIVKTFTVQADSSGKVTVVFTTVTDNAKLSGLELLQ